MALTLAERIRAAEQARLERLFPTKRFKGGAFQDVIDFVSTPQAAITGVVQGIGAKEGIRRMSRPSEALGLDGVGGFAADVVLDPINLIGGGLTKTGAKALGTGRLATTAAKQAQLGQRSLINIFGRSVVPKSVNEAVYGAATKAADVVKIIPGIRRGFGATPSTGRLS